MCACVRACCTCDIPFLPSSQAIGTEEEEEEEEEEVLEVANSHDEEVGKGVKTRSSVKYLVKRRKKKSEQEAKPPSFIELLKLNKPDWPLVLVGVIFSAIIGCLFPLQAVLFSDILRVSEHEPLSSYVVIPSFSTTPLPPLPSTHPSPLSSTPGIDIWSL